MYSASMMLDDPGVRGARPLTGVEDRNGWF